MTSVKNHTFLPKLRSASALIYAIGGIHCAMAAPISFDFNTLADGATNSKVDAYMQAVLNANGLQGDGNSVTVTGAKGERNYTGDNYVVGPQVQTGTKKVWQNGQWVTVPVYTPVSLTLGNSEHATVAGAPWVPGNADTFLVNSGSDRITITFDFAIYAVQFDYEIFPNAQCPNGSKSTCAMPDFTFMADGVLQFQTLGLMPGNGGTYANSPQSGTHTELAPQYLGMSGWQYFPQGVTKLEFVDWPVMIGIDNLVIDPTPPERIPPVTVPEPASVGLLSLGLAALGYF